MVNPVDIKQQQEIAIITINNPPVNALSHAVRQCLIDAILQLQNNQAIKAAVLICSGKTFIAGADISEFGKPPLQPHLPEVLDTISQSNKPIIAALHGTVLGGGLETALSCHYRVALKHTRIGLPEVNLGLIPGAGGTQLLPRAIGVEHALDMITEGKPRDVGHDSVAAAVDLTLENKLYDGAIAFAHSVIAKHQPIPRLRDKVLEKQDNHEALFSQWRDKLAKKRRGQPAAQACINSIENAVVLDFNAAMFEERASFIRCRDSQESAAMRHAFFAERVSAKLEGSDTALKPVSITHVGVIGAGTMGAGIAMCFADAGIPVTLVEMTDEYLQRGIDGIAKRYVSSVNKGRMSEAQYQTRMALINGTTDYHDLGTVDLVVEAAFESMDVKHDIFTKLDRVCKPAAILASNTSYLDINEIAAITKRQDKVVGMHFFSPANIMKLLEIVKTDKASQSTLKSVIGVAKRINKIVAIAGVCYGFIGNRMYARYGSEAQSLLLEGAMPEQIDAAMREWGMAMGPLEVGDMSGLDIGYHARKAHPNPPADTAWFLPANTMVEAGRLGQKTGCGYYRYVAGKKEVDKDALQLIQQAAANAGFVARNISKEEIQSRLINALADEGKHILNEGIAQRASDIDVIWLNGYGFPRFKGGPMFYAEQQKPATLSDG